MVTASFGKVWLVDIFPQRMFFPLVLSRTQQLAVRFIPSWMPGAEFKYVLLHHSIYLGDLVSACKTPRHTFYKARKSHPELAISDEQISLCMRNTLQRKSLIALQEAQTLGHSLAADLFEEFGQTGTVRDALSVLYAGELCQIPMVHLLINRVGGADTVRTQRSACTRLTCARHPVPSFISFIAC